MLGNPDNCDEWRQDRLVDQQKRNERLARLMDTDWNSEDVNRIVRYNKESNPDQHNGWAMWRR